MAGEARAFLEMARVDAQAARSLSAEMTEWLEDEEEDIDEDMILPIAKEIQAKMQAVNNRIEKFVIARDDEGEE